MNVFHRFSRSSLARNRIRTLATLIGIVLSMALVTAVVQGAYSGLQFLIRSEQARTGAFHGYYYGLSEEEAERARQAPNVKDAAVWRTLGWAEIESSDEYKPYLLLRGVSENFTDLVAVSLVSGRLPQNSGEILLPDHLASNGGPLYQPGDSLTLALGQRARDGQTLGEFDLFEPASGERLTGLEKRQYTVVGIYRRFDSLLEDFGCAGYTALTCEDAASGECASVFFSVRHPSRFYEDMERYAVSAQWKPNTDLLLYSGSVRSINFATFLYGFAGMLVFLIALGSVSLIYNAFAISVSERTRQFGILKSVGATKKQIRGTVLYEALLLGGAGVLGGAALGCLGMGVTLWALRDAFTMIDESGQTQMKLVVSPAGLLIAAAVCLLTTLISAWIPARRANRVSPIDAIRQTHELRIRKQDVKVSPLIQKLFGFEGMMAVKNFRRNRRRYRATVLSLVLSVTMFIASSSFCSYLSDLVDTAASQRVESDITYYLSPEDEHPLDELLADLTELPGVNGGCYEVFLDNWMAFPTEAFSDAFRRCIDSPLIIRYSQGQPDYGSHEGAETLDLQSLLVFADDEAFRDTCSRNGLDAAAFFDRAAPRALFYNRNVTRIFSEDGTTEWFDAAVLEETRLPATAYLTLTQRFEGYELLETEADAYYFYPQDYLQQFYASPDEDGDESPDRSRAMKLTAAEATRTFPLTLGAVVQNTELLIIIQNMPAIIYPYSMMEAVLGQDARAQITRAEQSQIVLGLRAKDHVRVYDAAGKALAARGMSTGMLVDQTAELESRQMLVRVVRVFSYGFITLISLIAIANVFNTISTGVLLRRRELAMLKSVGLGEKSFRKMMNDECLVYGFKSLVWGIPASLLLSWRIHGIYSGVIHRDFYIPWPAVLVAVCSVFAVVFATMVYATRVIRRDNPIDALKQENL